MNTDHAALQGSWKIVSLAMEGQSVPPASFAGARIVVDQDRFTSLGMGATYEGRMELNESTTPRQFNLHFSAGPERGNTALGIYELNGDSWRICLTTRGSQRPERFAAVPGTGFALESLEREHPPAGT